MFWQRVGDWIETQGPNVLAAIGILVGGYLVALLARRILRRVLARSRVDTTVTAFVGGLTYFAILGMAVVAMLARFGVETASFVALFGAVAFAIGFALQGALANFAAGLIILILRPYKVGDFITAGGTAGTVREIQLFSTSLTTLDNLHAMIPNGKIGSDIITNHSTFDIRPLDVTVGITYGASIQEAVRVLQGVLKSDARVLADPAPQVLVTELGPVSVRLLVRGWVKRMAEGDFCVMRFELTQRVKETLAAAGFEVPMPAQVVHLQNTPPASTPR
jgi:small conductance mechanosensitive channel